jgi:hypothetical protein
MVLPSTYIHVNNKGTGTMIDDDDSPRHRRSSYRHNECDEDSYDRAVAWCREIISSGGRDDMLFSPRAFHREIASASSRFGLPFEVRSKGMRFRSPP